MAQDVLVIAQHMGGAVADITFEMVAAARQVASALGGSVDVLLAGHGVEGLAAGIGGAGRVLLVEDPRLEHFTPEAYAALAAAVVQERAPHLVLVGNTSQGMDLGPAVAAALDRPLVGYLKAIQVEGGEVAGTCSLYGGKIDVSVTVPEGAVCTVMSGIASADAGRAGEAPAVERVTAAALGDGRVRFRALHEPEAGDVDITRMDVLVSVGRGIGDQGNIALAEELAEVLGGAVAASRPVVDSGWLPRSRQVGKSGLTVKPRCYIAAGISGAPEHLEGMRDASLIIAINTDPAAPIFDVAHYGAVADALEILPALAEQLKQHTGA